MNRFELKSDMTPQGDQQQAIEALVGGLRGGAKCQTLLGVTGSGKTFTMANVIEEVNRPTLVISHNKTLAAQLYEEFKELFPDSAVEYFVSYYDYYQPEAYIPARDIYIEKEVQRNDDLDRLRLSATASLTSRRDVIIVASVSCIFGLGSPDEYKRLVVAVRVDEDLPRDDLLVRLTDMQYQRKDADFQRSTFRVRGDTVEVHPGYEEFAYRIEFFGDTVERIELINPVSGKALSEERQVFIFPAVHYVMPEDNLERALVAVKEELTDRVIELKSEGKLLEAQRLGARTKYDLEMMREVGYCMGIENYSRHLDGRPAGSRPWVLIDYFPEDYLLIIDESHVTLPQLRAMFNGDQQRKRVLVEHGFRLPSAMDNRPLTFDELEELWGQVVFVSATPSNYELEACKGEVVEQIIRPTGLLDPKIEVRPAKGQVVDLLGLAQGRAERNERVIVTTLTKRMAEQLAAYLSNEGLRCRYLHSEIDTLDRVAILRDLRAGEFDVIVGVNLLREGLDLPEVSLVAILDADKEGFLRSETSLIQMIGRTARNVNAEVILYADKVTPSMRRAIDETCRRREVQEAYNQEHDITPQTIRKAIRDTLRAEMTGRQRARELLGMESRQYTRQELSRLLEDEMQTAARDLEFERAAKIRDKLKQLKSLPTLEVDDATLLAVTSHEHESADPPGTPGVAPPKRPRRKKKSRRRDAE